MLQRNDLKELVLEALIANGGREEIVAVARHIWKAHEQELRASGDLFYTWQYDMRWAATRLRGEGRLVMADLSPRGVWEISKQ
jgi:hypothetical protein